MKSKWAGSLVTLEPSPGQVGIHSAGIEHRLGRGKYSISDSLLNIGFNSSLLQLQCLKSGDGASFSHWQPPSIDAHGLRCVKVSNIENDLNLALAKNN